MASLGNDFTQYALGTWPTQPNDWTERWLDGISSNSAIISGGIWRQENDIASAKRRFATWDSVSESADGEIYAEVQLEQSDSIAQLGLRCSGGDISEGERNGYVFWIRGSSELLLRKMVSGTETTLASGSRTISFSSIYCFVAKATGDLIEMWVWDKDSESKPATPTLSVTDTTFTGSGRLQVGNVNVGTGVHVDYHYVGFGTDGDPALTGVPLVEFSLSATPTFDQTVTVTTTNWGAEDPTSVDITDSEENTITLSLTATATDDEYTFDMPTISETEGTSVSGLLSGDGTIRVYSATGDDVSQSTTISYGAVWENVATLESGFNTKPTSQITPSPVAGDQLAGQDGEIEPLANGNLNTGQGIFPLLHIQASTGTIYTHEINTAELEDVGGGTPAAGALRFRKPRVDRPSGRGPTVRQP